MRLSQMTLGFSLFTSVLSHTLWALQSKMSGNSISPFHHKPFSYKWKLGKLSDLTVTENGFSLISPTFTNPHCSSNPWWYIKFFPNGATSNDLGYISVFLYCASHYSVPVKMVFYLCDVNGHRCYSRTNEKVTFCEADNTWGFNKFLHISILEKKAEKLLPSGELTLCCELSIGNLPECVSRCVSVHAPFEFTWRIGHFALINLPSRKWIQSPSFYDHSGTTKWHMRLFPHANSNKHISVYLDLDQNDKAAWRAKCIISLLDSNGNKYFVSTSILAKRQPCIGWTMFVERDDLFAQAAILLPREQLAIHIEIAILQDDDEENENSGDWH